MLDTLGLSQFLQTCLSRCHCLLIGRSPKLPLKALVEEPPLQPSPNYQAQKRDPLHQIKSPAFLKLSVLVHGGISLST